MLQIEPGEIEPAHPLDGYDFDRVHRGMLGRNLQDALGVEIDEGVFFENHSIDSIAAAVLEGTPALRNRFDREEAPAGTEVHAPQRQDPERNDGRGFSLGDLAYTLQVGRDAMDEDRKSTRLNSSH